MLEAVFESLAQGLRKFATLANGWLPRPPQFDLDDDARGHLTGRYCTKDGQNFEVTRTENGFRIAGLTQAELLPIDRVTLYDSTDSEALVRFQDLQRDGYSHLAVTHPLRLTISAFRV